MFMPIKNTIKTVKSKCDYTINKINYEHHLIKTVHEFNKYSTLNITDCGEIIFIYDNLINMSIKIPVDPVLQKIYAKRGEKATLKDFMAHSEKFFKINGNVKTISPLTATIVLYMVFKEIKRRETIENKSRFNKRIKNVKTR